MTPALETVSIRVQSHGNAWRPWLLAAVGGSVLTLLLDGWVVQGLLVPVVVTSGSMAPNLRGPHRKWRCTGCQRDFVCGVESLPIGAQAICPNCGTANDAEQGSDRRGDRVLVDRSAFVWRAPRRWETVVFPSPEDSSALCVKRVVGLPGERIEIRDGDVFIDGQVARKSPVELRAMAVVVHQCPRVGCETQDLASRWQAEPSQTWRSEQGHWLHPATPQTASFDWLVYRHQQRLAADDAPRPGPILDESPYDQAESRVLNVVHDLLLRCEVQASGLGSIALRASSRGDRFEVTFDLDTTEGQVLHNEKPVASFVVPSGLFRKRAVVELVLADQQLQLAVNGRLLVEYAYEPDNAAEIVPQNLAIGVRGDKVELRNLQVLRDVYYTASVGNSGERDVQYCLGPNEYLLLGDNSPHAVDSRVWWPDSPMSGSMIVGRAVRW